MSREQRRLAAIMFTDMVGYTALGQRKESLSLVLVEEQRKLLRPIFARHNGREIKAIGDAFLVEFHSALEAAKCAYDIQRAVKEFNIALPDQSQLHLRIGVHLGDVVESEGDIAGDAVNVASRIEHLAEDGGICITRQVYDHIKNKVDLQISSVGFKSLKNVAEPAEVYKIVMPWEADASASIAQLDGKRLAVMPFVNMSPDPNDAYFADGLTEELISTLSSISDLTVISRTSIMKYKGASATISEIGHVLKVGSIIEGSVRKTASRLRIAAQLIDVRTDGHLWSRTYDREMDDIFAIQSEIAQKVADALKVQLLMEERKEVEKRATESTEAYTMYLKGRYYWNERTRDGIGKAVKYFEEAIRLDSRYAFAYSGLADCYAISADWFWMDPNVAFPKAKEYNLKALEMDPDLAEAHATLGLIHNSYDGRWHEAENEFRKAIELKPGLAYAHMWYGIFLNVLGRFDESFYQISQASRLDPLSRIVGLNLGGTLVLMGRSKEAIAQIEKSLKEDPSFSVGHENLGWAYYLDSRPNEAVDEIRLAFSLSNNDSWMKTSLACVLALAGRREEASRLLNELEETAKTVYVSKVQLAQILFALGNSDEAFRKLDLALQDRSIFTNHANDVAVLRFMPWYGDARRDPRWAPFERRLGL